MTLRDCIALYEAHTAAERPSTVLTPLGQATVAAYRLRRHLATVAPEDRTAICDLLVDERQPAN